MTTRFISFRSDDVGGAVAPATILDADVNGAITYRPVAMTQAAADAAGAASADDRRRPARTLRSTGPAAGATK